MSQLPTNTPSSLINAAQNQLNSGGTKPTEKRKGKSYQFPSAPTNFCFPDGRRVLVPDGVHYTEDPEEIKMLDDMVAVGTIWAAGAIEVAPQMTPPDPIDPAKTN